MLNASSSRRLGTGGLLIFGLVLVQPIAPVPIFGLASQLTQGHATLALLCAMVAMIPTAFSYGRMAATYPSGGSAYTYAARELHPRVGFLAGWAMGLDYLLIPVISALYAALTVAKLLPWLPVSVALLMLVVVLTAINVAGTNISFRANLVLLAIMAVAVATFVAFGIVFLSRHGGVSALVAPASLLNAETFSLSALWRGTGLMALTFLGFDGVSTLADEARSPERTVPRATFLVVLLTGVLGTIEVHLAHVVWPTFKSFPEPETAFLDVSSRVGGGFLLAFISVTLILAAAGTFLSAQAGAARLLYAMGRDGALPAKPFAQFSESRRVPQVNVILVGLVAIFGAALLTFEQAAQLVNFGALVAFLAVNAAAAVRCFRLRRFAGGVLAIVGFAFCLTIGLGLSVSAQLMGATWLALGTAGIVVVVARGRHPVPRITPTTSLVPTHEPKT